MVAKTKSSPSTLPTVGKAPWRTIAPFVGVSRETWRLRSSEGKAPPALRYSVRCTLFDLEQVHLWIRSPMTYTAPQP